MDIKTRLTRCCGKPIGGDNCREGMRCSDCFDKLEGLREIERLLEALHTERKLRNHALELAIDLQKEVDRLSGFSWSVAESLQQKESE